MVPSRISVIANWLELFGAFDVCQPRPSPRVFMLLQLTNALEVFFLGLLYGYFSRYSEIQPPFEKFLRPARFFFAPSHIAIAVMK